MHLQQLALTARESWLPEKPAMCPDSFRLIRQPANLQEQILKARPDSR